MSNKKETDIIITLVSPIVRPYIDDFIKHLFGTDYTFKYRYRVSPRKVEFEPYTGKAYVPDKRRYSDVNYCNTKQFGTSRMSGLSILESLLNNRQITVHDTKWNGERSVNQKETQLANEKAEAIRDEFRRWIFSNEKRKEEILEAYNDKYQLPERPVYNGDKFAFPGMDDNFSLRPYQKDGVAGILYHNENDEDSKNTLLCHTVGSGKTAIMIAGAMKLKEFGISPKNLFVVPNNILEQWGKDFKSIYPNARVLVADPKKDFCKAKREATLQKIRDDTTLDAIIMAQSSFDRLWVSRDFIIKDLKDQAKRLNRIQARIIAQGKPPSEKLMKDRKKVSDKFVKYASQHSDEGICFDHLNITGLFVDESQYYKNLPTTTSLKIKGVPTAESKKSSNMLYKVRCVQQNGARVVFATGTPISNTLAEVFVLQQYLEPNLLEKTENDTFDAFVANFAEITENPELDVTTSKYQITRRLGKFNNLQLLVRQFSQVAIFHNHQLDNTDLPAFDGYEDIVVKKTRALGAYLHDLSVRASAVKAGMVDRSEDNMLLITTDGRKAALDIRLVDPEGMFSIDSKAYRCAEKVAEIYFQTKEEKLTQVIFCDYGTPKTSFNMYDELKRLLLNEGVDESDIAFIHDYKTEAQKRKLFEAVNNGDIRIVIGSTSKLGVGVNIQERLFAAHHLDTPWRPSDLIQREGRILRQGNTNKKVRIFRYITEGSFDAYSWQLVEAKQRFISEFSSGQVNVNTASDIDNTVLSYAQIKALCIGNPRIKERVEKQNELTRLLLLRTKENEEQLVLEDNLRYMKKTLETLKEERVPLRIDAAKVKDNPKPEKLTADWKQLRSDIRRSVMQRPASQSEKFVATYRGFDLILPAEVQQDDPHLLLIHHGSYRVELGESDKGIMVRIDNALDAIPTHLERLNSRIQSLTDEMSRTEQALRSHRKDKYDKQIETLREVIRDLDDEIAKADK